jgi:multicomponent Na+:H+ antiporter subunit E
VAKVALHPKMNDLIDPHIIRFKTKLKRDISLVTFANSITLTPGTITILIRDGYYFVHSLDMQVAGDLPGEMEERVAHIFMEDQDG